MSAVVDYHDGYEDLVGIVDASDGSNGRVSRKGDTSVAVVFDVQC
jgi:hypothetical protein